MVSADRQLIIETNQSLRNIKTELENLLEKGVIDEAVFDSIHAALPQESSLAGPLRTATAGAAAAASPAPPCYDDTPPPGLPRRNVKPVVAQVRALHAYAASDGRDLSFEKDDAIAVHERLNQDWWLGQNLRTGQEGIFPRTYVLEDPHYKAAPASTPYAQPQCGYPPGPQGPPAQQSPYSSSVPPMAVAEGGQPAQGGGGSGGDSKMDGYGKKFGKKLGNAAIFGAGATIGGNIVNSIF